MARFLHHEPCPNCGSKDNLGRYDDGSAHCFGGCGYFERASHAPRREYTVDKETTNKGGDSGSYAQMPEDAGHDFPAEAVEWLAKYGIGLPEAIQRGVLWSNSRRQLLFRLTPQGDHWQVRNFDPKWAKKFKYFTQGDVNDHLPIYSSAIGGGQTLVLVEDCTSALKIARQSDSMPLLGSHLSAQRLNRLARLYSGLIVWLDSDKLKEAWGIANRAKFLGLSTKVIWTELDPKEYTDFMISNYLGVKNATTN